MRISDWSSDVCSSDLLAEDARLVFIDDGAAQSHINGHAVMSFARFKEEEVDDKHVALAVAASAVRAEMARKCDEAGLPLLSVWANDVIVMDDVELAEGARSEERRVGKEGGSKWRCRGARCN